MKKYYISALLLSFSFSLVTVSAQVVDTDTSGNVSSCITINNNLSYKNRAYNNKDDVMMLQDFLNGAGYLNSDSITGFFGKLTEKATAKFQNDNGLIANPDGYVGAGTRAKIKELSCGSNPTVSVTPTNTSTIAVPGMSKYTDNNFGFSFWYPSSWNISEEQSGALGYSEGSVVKTLRLVGNGQTLTISEFTSPTLAIGVPAGACGYCMPVTYFFDKDLHQWMIKYPMGGGGEADSTLEQIEKSKLPKPADISKNTMGGLHMFSTGQKESAVIVPLSARNFLIIKDLSYTEKCGSFCASKEVKGGAEYLASSILATDPSVATPVGNGEQIKTIQAEAKAYTNINDNQSSTNNSNLPTGCKSTEGFSPLTGIKCLMVNSSLPAGCSSASGFSLLTGIKCLVGTNTTTNLSTNNYLNKSPVISSLVGPVSLTVNETGAWSAQVTDPDNDTMRYMVRWGDEPETGDVTYPFNWPSLGFATEYSITNFSHSYKKEGTYFPTFYVVDNADVNHVVSKYITILVKPASYSAKIPTATIDENLLKTSSSHPILAGTFSNMNGVEVIISISTLPSDGLMYQDFQGKILDEVSDHGGRVNLNSSNDRWSLGVSSILLNGVYNVGVYQNFIEYPQTDFSKNTRKLLTSGKLIVQDSSSNNSNLLAGCKSTEGFSPLTGVKCSTNSNVNVSQMTTNQVLNGFDQCDQQFKNGIFSFPGGYQEWSKWELPRYNEGKPTCAVYESFIADSIVFADLDGDGINEALVPARMVRADSGGAIYVFKNINGVARVIDTVIIGKGNGKVISVDKDIVVVETDGSGGYVPLKETYKFVNNKLVKIVVSSEDLTVPKLIEKLKNAIYYFSLPNGKGEGSTSVTPLKMVNGEVRFGNNPSQFTAICFFPSAEPVVFSQSGDRTVTAVYCNYGASLTDVFLVAFKNMSATPVQTDIFNLNSYPDSKINGSLHLSVKQMTLEANGALAVTALVVPESLRSLAAAFQDNTEPFIVNYQLNEQGKLTPKMIVSKNKEVYENGYLKLDVPSDWNIEPVNTTALNITKGNYILYINTRASQASGIVGGRLGEILSGAPSADAVIKDYSGAGACVNLPISSTDIANQNLDLHRVDLFATSQVNTDMCNIPAMDKNPWFASYVRHLSGGYFNYTPTSQATTAYVITMSYNSRDITKLPEKESSELSLMLKEMTDMVATLQLK